MNLQNFDIVYFVKDTEENEELRYSLRSVSENFPHRNVYFVGGKPRDLEPDNWLKVKQNEVTKWNNTSLLLRTACLDDTISENFILFNDDFFIMHPVEELPYYSDGPLAKRISALHIRYGKLTNYTLRLKQTLNILQRANLPTANYAMHIPMIINKNEMLDTFDKFPDGLMWRSLYGNHHKKPIKLVKDCKITDYTTLPDKNSIYVSTADSAFNKGNVGRYIRKMFTETCKFERKT